MATQWLEERWAGGRIAERQSGRRVYYIERQVRGRRVGIALKARDLEEAGDELRKFEDDPEAYLRDRARESAAVVRLDVDTMDEFLEHLKANGRALTYRLDTHSYLKDWHAWFKGRGIREVTTAQLAEALKKWKSRKQRIIAIKSFCSFLRTEKHVLRTADDPTLDLKVPAAVPESTIREKGYQRSHVELVYRFIEAQDVRDIVRTSATTGMHGTEVNRVALRRAVLKRVDTGTAIAGTVTFGHKSKKPHINSVPIETFAALERIAALGKVVDKKRVHREIERAVEHASEVLGYEVPKIMPGELRHSYVTWQTNYGKEIHATTGGVSLQRASEVVGHRSKQTTRKFYDATAVPVMVDVGIHLVHPDDPPIPEDGSTRPSAVMTPAEDDAA